MFGIDVSDYQGDIDWETVKGQIDFAILKIGWIGNFNNHKMERTFERNFEECKRLKIPIGIYVYCYSNSTETVLQGAEWVINQLDGRYLEMPIFLDMEDHTIVGSGQEELTNMCIEFVKYMEEHNYRAGVYANQNWFKNYLAPVIKTDYITWIAHYGPSGNSKYKGEFDMWQNSSTGQLDGITANVVDTNYLYTDLIVLEAEKPLIGEKSDLQYRVHVENLDWSQWYNDGEIAGTQNKGLRIEAIQFQLKNGVELKARAHIEKVGWTDWKNGTEIIGTEGKGLRIEALEIECNRKLKASEHIQNIGWLPSSQGEKIKLGTETKGLRMEALKIKLV